MTYDSAKPIKQAESDRPKPIDDARLAALEELSALDQELELKHGIKGNPMIKAQERTPDGPVAWALMRHGEVEQVAVHPVYLRGDIHRFAPLYAHQPPTLTDAEREAIEKACELADHAGFHSTTRAILRGLLERTAKRDTNGPRNGAVRGHDPDSRVWETQGHTPDSQPTPGECSTQEQGTCPPPR